jgi:uncharacterized protein YggU (UPF0235/DUF167 family)
MIAGQMSGPTKHPEPDDVVTDGPGGAVIRVRVTPRSKRRGVRGIVSAEISVGVGSPPEDGRATAEAIASVAAWLGVPGSRISLSSGAASRSKRLVVAGATAAGLRAISSPASSRKTPADQARRLSG